MELDGAFVGLVFDDEAEDPISIAELAFVWCVATQKDSSCTLSLAVEKVRLACLCEALAGKFGLVSDDNGFPGSQVSSLGGSDECYRFVGNSLCGPSRTQHNWFDQQRARLDQTLRMGLMDFERSLREACYVGPKRSTVPRNLDSDVMDEYTSWGDGLGAWNWLSHCSDDDFDSCSKWLMNEAAGLNTGLSLEREVVYEIEASLIDALKNYDMKPREFLDCIIGAATDTLANRIQDWESAKTFQKIFLRQIKTGQRRHPQEVGEGITQVIPVIAACVRSLSDEHSSRLVAIEQPELHLHPSLAARIADLVVATMLMKSGRTALIETHSEHLILRVLRRIRQTTDQERPEHIPEVEPDKVCVLWVDNFGDGATFNRLRIDEHGEFIDRWPKGFFSERAEELY